MVLERIFGKSKKQKAKEAEEQRETASLLYIYIHTSSCGNEVALFCPHTVGCMSGITITEGVRGWWVENGGRKAGWQGRWVCGALNVVVVACAFGIGEKEAEDAERHRLAEHIRNQSFVHSDILKDKLDEVRHCARSQL
jgi:hypothetical protein